MPSISGRKLDFIANGGELIQTTRTKNHVSSADEILTDAKTENKTETNVPAPRGRRLQSHDNKGFTSESYHNSNEATCKSESFCPNTLENETEKKRHKGKADRKWLILAAAFFDNFLCNGFAFNMSILNVAFLEEFGKSKAETALVQSVTTGMFFMAGLLTGTLVGKYGVRKVGILGGLLASLGLILSYFATTIPHLVATLGIITGLGFSAIFVSASTSIGEYFDGKSKFLALSVVSCGSGVGATASTYFLNFLIGELGWRGCLLICGGLMMHVIPFFALCKPKFLGVPSFMSRDSTGQKWIQNIFRRKKHSNSSSRLSVFSSTSVGTVNSDDNSNGFTSKLKELGKNREYVLYTFAMACTLPVINSALIFSINFLQSKGFDNKTSVFLLSCVNISSLVARVTPGLCKQIPRINILMIPVFYTCIGTVVLFLLTIATSYLHFVILMSSFGLTLGGSATVISVATMELVGLKNYSAGLGTTLTIVGTSNTIAGPIAGLLRDVTGSYTISFYVMSAGLGLATCLLCLVAILRKFKDSNADKPDPTMANVRRRTKRRSSIFPWKRKVEFIY